jgi:hypothetical protein
MSMTAKELFGVGVRLIGLVTALVYLPALVLLHYVDGAMGVIGLLLLTRADLIAHLCYPKDATDDALKRALKDSRKP